MQFTIDFPFPLTNTSVIVIDGLSINIGVQTILPLWYAFLLNSEGATSIKHAVEKKRKLMFHHDPSVETVKRSIVKTITYRVVISMMEFAFIYYVTGRSRIAIGFIAVSTIYSMITFYFHDRAWDKIKWGKVNTD